MTIEHIKIFEYSYDNHLENYITKLVYDEKLHLMSNSKLYINCNDFEYITKYKIELRRLDGLRIIFDINNNGKNGNLEYSNTYQIKHTIKSIIYYLCG